MSCGAGHRLGLDLALLWLWHKLVVTAPIRPLAWEPPYVLGVALKRTKDQKKKKKKEKFLDVTAICKQPHTKETTLLLVIAFPCVSQKNMYI